MESKNKYMENKEKAKLNLKPGVIYGKELNKLFEFAKGNKLAIPAVNVVSSSTINACMEAAKVANSPIIIQFSHGGGQFMAGKSIPNSENVASIAGCISGALMVHELAKVYGVCVILHTDHCSKKLLPWVDELLQYGENYYMKTGRPLFSSHMLDLSVEKLDENIAISKKYLERMAKIEMHLEIELGITGGEEDGVNNSDIEENKLYTQPSEVDKAWAALVEISPNFTIAASFGNVHGVYQPGNVKLEPTILQHSQQYISQVHVTDSPLPVNFVFHGGSGSDKRKIHESLSYGVVKMNLDTDFQWAYWNGVREYYNKNTQYLQGQLGNPQEIDAPNKKYYDPRAWLRNGEISFVARLIEAYKDLNSQDILE